MRLAVLNLLLLLIGFIWFFSRVSASYWEDDNSCCPQRVLVQCRRRK